MFKFSPPIFFASLLCMGCDQNDDARAYREKSLAELEREYPAWVAKQPRPSATEVERIEDALRIVVRSPRAAECAMSFSKSHRYYHFRKVRAKDLIDTSVISVAMMEGDDIAPGVTVEGPEEFSQPDDVQANVLKSEFSLKSGELAVIWCGPNQGSPPTLRP